MSKLVKEAGLNPAGLRAMRIRSPPRAPHWGVAQLVERLALNQEVAGAKPATPATQLSWSMDDSLPLCLHHIHHSPDGSHTVHHCGNDHPGEPYTVKHCQCGLHVIEHEYVQLNAHSLNELPTVVRFTSKCPHAPGYWHVESGRKV